MKITFSVTIEVDKDKWIMREGLDEGARDSAVRADIREYLFYVLNATTAAEDTDMIIWKGWKPASPDRMPAS